MIVYITCIGEYYWNGCNKFSDIEQDLLRNKSTLNVLTRVSFIRKYLVVFKNLNYLRSVVLALNFRFNQKVIFYKLFDLKLNLTVDLREQIGSI